MRIDLDQSARGSLAAVFKYMTKLGQTKDSSVTAPRQRGGSLYESIGGHIGVAALVERFYQHVLEDPALAPFFKHTSMDRLRHMQVEFFAAALDGPTAYGGTAIRHAHQGLKIALPDLQRFVKHMFDTLSDFDISEDERYEIVQCISKYADDVTGAPGGY